MTDNTALDLRAAEDADMWRYRDIVGWGHSCAMDALSIDCPIETGIPDDVRDTYPDLPTYNPPVIVLRSCCSYESNEERSTQ